MSKKEEEGLNPPPKTKEVLLRNYSKIKIALRRLMGLGYRLQKLLRNRLHTNMIVRYEFNLCREFSDFINILINKHEL